jgi:biopolymer transport protein TolQ
MTISELMVLLFGSEFYVTLITILLIILSIAVWGVVGVKWKRMFKIHRDNQIFSQSFARCDQFLDISTVLRAHPEGAFSAMSAAALQEYKRLPAHLSYENLEHRAGLINETVERVVEVWKTEDERWLSAIAISSNLGPFLGLLGTVWGIMDAFFAIGKQGSAELSVIAPGIAAALVSTVLGLLVAIPAAVAFNLLQSRNARLLSSYDAFASELMGLFRRTDLQLIESEKQG